jgi:nucleotide-binding universal stress UspA family protein
MVPSSILVPTDGSGPARAAELFAADVANLMAEAEVRIINVIPMTCVGEMVDYTSENVVKIKGLNYRACTLEESEAAQRVLGAAAERVQAVAGAGVKVTTKVVEAPSPAGAIVEEAGSECGLIVMGNRGLGGFGSLVLGSVSTQVLHGAQCAVAIIKEEA